MKIDLRAQTGAEVDYRGGEYCGNAGNVYRTVKLTKINGGGVGILYFIT